jgi:hypothetical protein
MSPLRSALVIALATLAACTGVSMVGAQRATVVTQTAPAGTAMMQEDVPKTCPITKPPARPFIPPSPYPAKTAPDRFWFGTEKLWINLSTDGTWRGLPHYRPTDASFRQKLFWWRQGYDWRTENPPKLTVTGRRLDSPAPPLASEHANAGWGDRDHAFMVVGIDLPTLGCWEITGHYENEELRFVIWVAQ